MYKLILKDTLTEEDKIFIRTTRGKAIEEVEGISDLYDSLNINGYCESGKASRVHYVAYTLADRFNLIVYDVHN